MTDNQTLLPDVIYANIIKQNNSYSCINTWKLSPGDEFTKYVRADLAEVPQPPEGKDALDFILERCYEAYQSNDVMIDMIGDAEGKIRTALQSPTVEQASASDLMEISKPLPMAECLRIRHLKIRKDEDGTFSYQSSGMLPNEDVIQCITGAAPRPK